MQNYVVRCLFVLLAAGSIASARAAPRNVDLDAWIVSDLTPYLAETLATHPRFRNEAVRFVVMQDGNPQANTSALALALRNQVQDALVDTPGIRVAWQADRIDVNRTVGSQRIDCTADEVHYYIGIEITEARSGRFDVGIRALDLEERSWVSGFGLTWNGMLTAMQHRAWQQFEMDPSFRGDREVPYLESQSDLLAAHLAHSLGCTLLRQVSGEYLVESLSLDGNAVAANDIVELVSNNLALYRALQFTRETAEANSQVEGKAHKIDDDLYQYWITVRPNDASAELPALSASAYIYMPENFIETAAVAELSHPLPQSSSNTLASLQLVELKNRPSWYALQTHTSRDAVLFYLHHQQGNGLVRLADANCERHTKARISRANEYLQFNLPDDDISTARWLPAKSWQAAPEDDSYYVVAVTDNHAARTIARHIEQLPSRCSASLRAGLEGAELRNWYQQFSAIEQRWKSAIEWQIIRVRSVY
jgi:hypothetical protein